MEKITNGFRIEDSTGAIFLDIFKAFDKVWQSALIHKLHTAGIRPYLTKTTQSFLHQRSFQVKINGHISTVHQIHVGVPQGSVVGPLFYNFYTHDIPKPPNTELFLYADDTAITVTLRDQDILQDTLQQTMDEISQTGKSKLMKRKQ